MIQHSQFTYFLYFLVYDIGETSHLKSIDWLRLKVARTSGLLNEEEKQIIDRIFHAVEHKRITLVEHDSPLAKPLSYQSYKMLCQNQPADYFCQLFNQLVETNTLNETDLQMLQQAQKSSQLNFEERQIVKRILYSLKRGRIKLAKTREVSPQHL